MSLLNDERLAAWLEGDLGPEEAARIQDAILSDPKVEAQLARIRAAQELIVDAGPVRAPPSLAGRVRAALEEVEDERRVPVVSAQMMMASLLAVVAVAVLMLLWPRSPDLASQVSYADAPAATYVEAPAAAVVLVPPGFRLVTPLPAESVRTALEAVGATWVQENGAIGVRFEANLARGVEQKLSTLGTLTPLGDPLAVRGQVAVRLELQAP